MNHVGHYVVLVVSNLSFYFTEMNICIPTCAIQQIEDL